MVDNSLSHFPMKCPECVGVCVCIFWKRVVIFILKHWGVRWREGAEEGRRREGEREERRIFHLNLLVFHCPL